MYWLVQRISGLQISQHALHTGHGLLQADIRSMLVDINTAGYHGH